MNIFVYGLFAYELTAVLSFIVVGIIVLTNKLLGRSQQEIQKES